MAWDVEGTKRRLLESASLEFSAHGLAGARVDRIAQGAGVNKERIYQYFGSKQELFAAVLTSVLARAADSATIDGTGVEAVGAYAGRLFDHHVQHPELARLAFWEGLEAGVPVAEEVRRAIVLDKVARLRHALPGIGDEDAAELLLTIRTLCDAWPALANVDRVYTASDPADPDRIARRRAAVVATAEAAARAFTR